MEILSINPSGEESSGSFQFEEVEFTPALLKDSELKVNVSLIRDSIECAFRKTSCFDCRNLHRSGGLKTLHISNGFVLMNSTPRISRRHFSEIFSLRSR